MTKLIIILASALITYENTIEFNKCECDEIKQKQILTQLEIDLIHVKRVQQNWDRHLK